MYHTQYCVLHSTQTHSKLVFGFSLNSYQRTQNFAVKYEDKITHSSYIISRPLKYLSLKGVNICAVQTVGRTAELCRIFCTGPPSKPRTHHIIQVELSDGILQKRNTRELQYSECSVEHQHSVSDHSTDWNSAVQCSMQSRRGLNFRQRISDEFAPQSFFEISFEIWKMAFFRELWAQTVGQLW